MDLERRLARIEAKITLTATAVGFAIAIGIFGVMYQLGGADDRWTELRALGVAIMFYLGSVGIGIWRINRELRDRPEPEEKSN